MDAAIEWGLPDWTQPQAYGATKNWSYMKWRWEFCRRRKDLRSAFDERAEDAYKEYLEIFDLEGSKTRVLKPHEAGFTATSYIGDDFGYAGIPNPRISDQPDHVIFSVLDYPGSGLVPYDGEDALRQGRESICLGSHKDFLVVGVDLRKPLSELITSLTGKISSMQKRKYGKKIEKRRQPTKWLTYLRVLDGRECGASWSQLSEIIPNSTARTEQTARDTWKQAKALCFNF
ncbi:hypothetical protein [Pseudogemmobacter faecipullorum]|uniref:Uncharacterized protein n=1 Tax=Pseudogemmobacter faecipullorum TaxID=2755041 RepID=A0ABS8CKR2_9RHOB|nr:hypothetical protein [Pseudogemmobacter faecipullorum]MCB5409445.1 hypothetical protein [Pseudogemmobacter faecipullorum]